MKQAKVFTIIALLLSSSMAVSGQVITSAGHYVSYDVVGANLPFSIPAGISVVYVDMWGPGGRGGRNGGGQGGGYLHLVLQAVQNTNLSVTVGSAGTATSVRWSAEMNATFTCYPGADNGAVDGGGYNVTLTASKGSWYGLTGHSGERSPGITYSNYGTNLYSDSRVGGNGGSAANSVSTGGNGGYELYENRVTPATTIITRKLNVLPTQGIQPGGGGGGSVTQPGAQSIADGANGGLGLVIISY